MEPFTAVDVMNKDNWQSATLKNNQAM